MKRVGSSVDDTELLPLSLLSQADYCLRRAALLLNERIWEESKDTAKGRAEHERVHTQRIERRRDEIRMFEMPVYSEKLCISGKCDCIEARRSTDGCIIPAADFPVCLFPVEFKHGVVREEIEYEIQLCAQAMCLEEMYGAVIPEGAIFYISSHRRFSVEFSAQLRQNVVDTALKLHRIRDELSIPAASYSNKCKKCSLWEYCLPCVKTSADTYCNMLIKEAAEV